MPKRSINPAQAIEIKRLYDIYNYMLENKENPDIGWDEVMKIIKSIPMTHMPGKVREVYSQVVSTLEVIRIHLNKKSEECILDRTSRSASKI
jgi:hypothetical protein